MFAHASMNRIYRLIWSQVLGAWIAVAESAKGKGKGGGRRKLLVPTLAALGLVGAAHAVPPLPAQLPTGATVVGGTAAVSQNGAAMTIRQDSARGVIDWQGFNVGKDARVQFQQPSAAAVTLNRVLGSQPSQIFGQIQANGQVFLSNPNGVYFSPSATVDVGGLVATTHGISSDDFMAGGSSFVRNGASASVVNDGALTAALGGYIALLAPEVQNGGVIVATGGTVALAAGEAFRLRFGGPGALADVIVEPSLIAALVENRHAVRAEGGLLILSARAVDRLKGGVVNNAGALEAGSLASAGGRVHLRASDRIIHRGAINVDAAAGGNGGAVSLLVEPGNDDGVVEADGRISALGGSVETVAARVRVGDGARVDTTGAQGPAGAWRIAARGLTVAATGGDISGAALGANLGGGNVSLEGGAGSVSINDAVAWSADTALTLTAAHNVNVNANIAVAGAGAGLAINPNTANGGAAASGSGAFMLGNEVKVNLPNVSAASPTALLIGGVSYTVINKLGERDSASGADLQGVGARLDGHYALGGDIDASATGAWGAGQGFAPLGTSGTPFGGVLDGLGHTVSNLSIVRPGEVGVGLFGHTAAGSAIRNLGLRDAVVAGSDAVGALAGVNIGSVTNTHMSGAVSGRKMVGGLVGDNSGGVSISYATGAVSGQDSVGGLVGHNEREGEVSISYATGAVNGRNAVGGLAGYNEGSIANSYASGAVSGRYGVGGFVGETNEAVYNSYSTGAVSAERGGDGFTGEYFSEGAESVNFWDVERSGKSLDSLAAGATTAEMKTKATFIDAGWDFATPVWRVRGVLNDGYPCLAAFASCQAVSPLSVRVRAATAGNVYGDAVGALTYALYQGDAPLDAKALDKLGVSVGGALVYGDAPTLGSNARLYQIVYASGLQLGGANGAEYALTPDAPLNYIVSKRPLAPVGQRPYDGTIVFNVGDLTLNNLVSGDCATGLAACGLVGAGSVTNKNATGVQQSLKLDADFGLRGGSLLDTNYTLDTSKVSGTIVKRGLNVTANVTGRIYDGSTLAAVTLLNDGVAQERLTLTAQPAAFASKNAGVQSVTVQGIVLSGDDAGNYVLNNTSASADGTIAPRPLTVSASGVSRVYDGSRNAAMPLRGDALPGDNLTLRADAAQFATKDVGTDLVIQLGPIALGGADAANYRLVDPPTTSSGAIAPRPLVITGRGDSRAYDGSKAVTGLVLGDNRIDGDVLSHVYATAEFASKDVGGHKAITVSGLALSGADARNYALASNSVSAEASITPRPLTLLSLTGRNRVYDGGTAATVQASDDHLANDVVALDIDAGFASKQAGSNKPIVIRHIALTGADAGNYVLAPTLPAGPLQADVTKAPLVVTASAMERVYDGGTDVAALKLGDNRIGQDDLRVTAGQAAYADKHAAVAKLITVGGLALTGADAGNYELDISPVQTRATIRPAPLTVSASVADRDYDGSKTAHVVFGDNRVSGDALTLYANKTEFATKDAEQGKRVAIQGMTLQGADAGNYVLTSAASESYGNILPRKLVVTASSEGRDFNGTASMTVALASDALAGDHVVLRYEKATAGAATVGTQTVVVDGIAIAGEDARNYQQVSRTAATSGVIKAVAINPDLVPVAPAPAGKALGEQPAAAGKGLNEGGRGGAHGGNDGITGKDGVNDGQAIGNKGKDDGLDTGKVQIDAGTGPGAGDRAPGARHDGQGHDGGSDGRHVRDRGSDEDDIRPDHAASGVTGVLAQVAAWQAAAATPSVADRVGGIVVTVEQLPRGELAGRASISIPGEWIARGGQFSAPLPVLIAEAIRSGDVDARATLADGQPLPAWLRFAPEQGIFIVAEAPAGALPVDVKITLRGDNWDMLLSARPSPSGTPSAP